MSNEDKLKRAYVAGYRVGQGKECKSVYEASLRSAGKAAQVEFTKGQLKGIQDLKNGKSDY